MVYVDDVFLDGWYLFGVYFYIEVVVCYYYVVYFFEDVGEVVYCLWFFDFGYQFGVVVEVGEVMLGEQQVIV